MSDDLAATLRLLVERFALAGAEYMVVGSIAALAHGRSRATQDLDVVAALDEDSLTALLRTFTADRFYVSEPAAREALRNRTLFNVIDMTSGWKIDIVPLKTRAFSKREFSRRKMVSVLGVVLPVATIEDTIVAKLDWSREAGGSARQLEDVRELVKLGGEQLDRTYIDACVAELGLVEVWQNLEATSS
jgi:hypothetical protein